MVIASIASSLAADLRIKAYLLVTINVAVALVQIEETSLA